MVAARLTVEGVVAAIEIGFADRRTWFAFVGAISPSFASLGPGHVQTADTIAHCRNSGLACYDLLPPSQPYKRVLSADSVPVFDYGMPLTTAGWISVLGLKWLPQAKAVFNRLPSGLRRAFASRLSPREQ
jgi:CelD/BcsL family acetyltransferase involved in cellulose biosynthesis